MELKALVASNIRALRKYKGETQVELGSYVGVSDSEISNYEKGSRGIDIEMLTRIANHYGVSEVDLLTCDFGDVGKIEEDVADFRDKIEIEFPIIKDDKHESNKKFMSANRRHYELYNRIKDEKTKCFDFTLQKLFENCIKEYSSLLKDERIREEVAANLVGLEMIYTMMITAELMNTVNANDSLVNQIPKLRDVRFVFDNCSSLTGDEKIHYLLKLMDYPNCIKRLTEHLTILMKSAKWHELGTYYLALQYGYGVVDNDSDPMANYRLGLEMMNALDMVGNPYAHRELMDMN